MLLDRYLSETIGYNSLINQYNLGYGSMEVYQPDATGVGEKKDDLWVDLIYRLINRLGNMHVKMHSDIDEFTALAKASYLMFYSQKNIENRDSC